MGISLYEIGRYDEALGAFEKAHELDPSDVWVWYYRSFILAKQERYAEAAEAAGTFLESEPDHADIWVIKGIAQYRTGKYGDAVVSLDQAILQNPLVVDA